MEDYFKQSTQQIKQILERFPIDSLYILIDESQFEQVNKHYINLFKPYKMSLIQQSVSPSKFSPNANILFLAKNSEIPVIISNILQLSNIPKLNLTFHLLITPKLSFQSKFMLNKHQVYDKISTFENVNFDISVTYDSNCYVYNSNLTEFQLFSSSLQPISELADTTFQLLKCLGGTKQITGVGRLAKMAAESLDRLIFEENLKFSKTEFSQVIFIDRVNDLLSCLLSGQNYSEQLDLFCKINQNKIENQPIYDEFDVVIKELKYCHINKIGDEISNMAQKAQTQVNDCKNIQKDKNQSISAISSAFEEYKKAEATGIFINEHTSRIIHIQKERNVDICSEILNKKEIMNNKGKGKVDFILKEISKGRDLQVIIEYLCLISMVSGGFRLKDLQLIKKNIVLYYDVQGLLLVNKFTDLGFITSNEVESVFPDVFKEFRINEDKDFEKIDINGLGYPFGGIIPLNIKLIQDLILGNKDKKKTIENWSGNDMFTKKFQVDQPDKQKFLIIYVGPVSHGEMAAINVVRKQCQKLQSDFQIQVLASSLKSNKNIMKTICNIQ